MNSDRGRSQIVTTTLNEIGMKCVGNEKSFIYKVRLACCTLAADHFSTSQTIRTFTVSKKYINFSTISSVNSHRFSCFLSVILRALQTLAHARRLTQCSVGTKTQTGLRIFAITCRPGLRFSFRSIYRNESSRSELSFCSGLM